jgi:small subunit ribosomal protein S8
MFQTISANRPDSRSEEGELVIRLWGKNVTVTDPIADMLTRMRNAIMVRHDTVQVPASRMKMSIAKILKEEGFITDFELLKGKPSRMIKIQLKYTDRNTPAITTLERASRPGLRVYVERGEIPRLAGGLGIAILSTSKGVMSGQQARSQGIGGELLCYVM